MECVTTEQISGLDLEWVDPAVRVADDLFTHVNGKWLESHTIPGDRSIDGAFHVLRDNAEADVRAIVEECAQSPGDATSTMIGDLYASFMDTERIEELGLEAVRDYLTAIATISSIADLSRTLGSLQRVGVRGLFGLYVDTDARRSDRYLVHLGQGGLGLPDESYYREENHAETLTAYRQHVAAMFGLAGIDDPEDAASRVVDMEKQIAGHHWDVVRRRDAEATYNLRTLAEFTDGAAGFDVSAWLTGIDAPSDETFAEVVVGQPSFFTGVGELVASRPLDDWKTWLQWTLLNSVAPYLSSAFVDENFAFYGTELTGAQEIRDRWKRGVGFVESAAGFAVGELYVAKHFPPAAKARMDELIANLVEAYRRNISDLDWMTPTTRERALAKLDKFTPKIGYPAKWIDYSTLQVDRGDLIGNLRRASSFDTSREFAKIGGPVDHDEWFMTPQTVNAYYNPGMNEIVFPAAIL
ncbi:M13 family metallopeptidase, partial [Gordonia sp. (in: high G+C Gram-positive bacteria)]|uniref:M13 family metallopeptidase n=1 Tax=Gordonia sp. (in: high G+C Gram-positive bacteria) TaxID=84139 RepID=UPI003F9D563A